MSSPCNVYVMSKWYFHCAWLNQKCSNSLITPQANTFQNQHFLKEVLYFFYTKMQLIYTFYTPQRPGRVMSAIKSVSFPIVADIYISLLCCCLQGILLSIHLDRLFWASISQVRYWALYNITQQTTQKNNYIKCMEK